MDTGLEHAVLRELLSRSIADTLLCVRACVRACVCVCVQWWRQTTPSTLVALDSTSGAYHWRENGYSFIMLQRNPYESFGVRCYPPLPGNCGGGTTSCNCAGQYTYQLQSTIANGWLEGQLAAATSWVSPLHCTRVFQYPRKPMS